MSSVIYVIGQKVLATYMGMYMRVLTRSFRTTSDKLVVCSVSTAMASELAQQTLKLTIGFLLTGSLVDRLSLFLVCQKLSQLS